MEHQEGYMVREEFTEDELIAALVNAQTLFAHDAGWLKKEEIVELSELSEYAVEKRLKALIREGKIEAGRAPKPNVIGEYQRVICYRLVPQTEQS